MKMLDPALAAHMATGATTLCHCWRLIRRDGTAMGFTDHDLDLTVAGTLCSARTGADSTAAEQVLGFAAGGGEVTGALASAALNETDLANGAYDGATIESWLVNWADTAQALLLDVHTLGQVARSEFAFTAEMRSLAQEFDQERGRLFQLNCAADLGDARCKVALTGASFVATDQVSATDGRIYLAAGLIGYANDWFSGGELRFTTGANVGATYIIKQHSVYAGANTLTLWTPAAAPIVVGDAFTVSAGCDKFFATCQDKFGNSANFRGFPHIPGNDQVLQFPSQADLNMDGGSLFR